MKKMKVGDKQKTSEKRKMVITELTKYTQANGRPVSLTNKKYSNNAMREKKRKRTENYGEMERRRRRNVGNIMKKKMKSEYVEKLK